MSGTKVYVAVWEDRNTSPTARVFTDPDKAVEWAKAAIRQKDRFHLLKEDVPSHPNGLWLYDGTYGEGCRIIVLIEVVDAANE